MSTSFESAAGTKEELAQGKHNTEAQDRSAATAEQLEQLDIADGEVVGTGAQQGAKQQGPDQHAGGAVDWENTQHSQVSES